VIRTERLVLRRWRDADRAPFAAMNADPEVMAHFPEALTRQQSDEMVDRIEAGFARRGFGLWAVEVPDEIDFAGFIGLNVVPWTAHFTPAVEIGWRLARPAWGHGYATEGATAALAYAFAEVLRVDDDFVVRTVADGGSQLAEVVSFTTPANRRSRRVMEQIGLHHDPADDFDNPRQPPLPAHLLHHVLYRLRREELTPRGGAASPG